MPRQLTSPGIHVVFTPCAIEVFMQAARDTLGDKPLTDPILPVEKKARIVTCRVTCVVVCQPRSYPARTGGSFMDPINTPSTDNATAADRSTVTDAALDALRGPLAVILGRAQLLERRILQGHTIPADEYLSVLSEIGRCVWDAEQTIRVIQEDPKRVPADR